MKVNHVRTSLVLLALLFGATASPLLSPTVRAQSPRSTVSGTVTDAQGASVSGAEVVALQAETNQRFTAISSEEGTFTIPAVPVGKYEVTATAAGFATYRQPDVVVEVGQRLRLDITLTVGALTDTVTVTGDVSRVRTEDSSLGETFERQRVENLPLNGRHVLDLVKLIPGAQPRIRSEDGFAEVDNQGLSQISFNGGPTYGNQIFLDGASNTVPVHNELSVLPMLDTVEEFKVVTNSLPAEFGQSNGGAINIVTRGGTNEFHGSLYEFVRNDAFDARNAFLTQRDPVTGRIKPLLRFNQYGGTFSGPVYLPRFGEGGKRYISGKNRTFFYFGYEQWKKRESNITRATVPTLAERNGDFSNTRDNAGRVIPIYDPATTRANPNGSGFVRDPFPGNVIPRDRLDALSLRVLQYFPLPNVTPQNAFTNLNNYQALTPFPTDQDSTSVRIDHSFTESDKIFGRYTNNRNLRLNRSNPLGPADTNARDDQRNNHNWLIGETHIFSPSVVNEFRASATRQSLDFVHPSFGGNFLALLGFPAIVPNEAFPAIDIAGLLTVGSARGGFAGGFRKGTTIQFTDAVTWVRGNHNLKFGTDQRWIRANFTNRVNPSGNFVFNAALTGNPLTPAGTGVSFASYLLGEVASANFGIRPLYAFQSWNNGSYVQDDWKVTRQLTLNLGVRYDLASGPVERFDRSSSFNPFVVNPQTNRLGVLEYAGVTKDRHFAIPPKTNFAPRLGFAYDVRGNGRTAIRGGYAFIYSSIDSGDTAGDNANSLGFSVDTALSAPGGAPIRAFNFGTGPAALLQPRGAAGGPSAFRGQAVRYQELRQPTPYVQQWNLSLEHELPGQVLITTAYAANRGVHLFGANYNLNQLDPQYYSLGLALQDQVPNPFFGQITVGPLAARTISRAQSLLPYPDYQAVTTLANHGASSTYHAFQLTAERRFADGFSALFSYTNSKLISDSFSTAQGNGGPGDFRVGRFNRRLDRAVDESDVSQRLTVSAVFELPVGRGRRFLSEGGVLGAILGGYQINTITQLQTGFPLVIRGANNFTNINWPNLVGDPSLENPTADRWFNTDAFRNPPNFVIGNVPRTLPSTRGPGYKNVDLSVFRNVYFTEKYRLELRAEGFNIFNFVNLGDPGTTFTAGTNGQNINANFGRITASLDARRFQFGARFSF